LGRRFAPISKRGASRLSFLRFDRVLHISCKLGHTRNEQQQVIVCELILGALNRRLCRFSRVSCLRSWRTAR
jgi:hypothetical protein